MLKYEEHVLKVELSKLPSQSRVAFAASCAQRLFTAYGAYSKATGHSAAKLETALEYLWTNLLLQPSTRETEFVLAEVMALIPTEGEPDWAPVVAYAEDAVSAVAYSLRCMLSSDPQEAAWAARCVYEALDQYVIARDEIRPGESGAESRILSDPTIQEELERQRRDIVDLQAVDYPSMEIVRALRLRSSNDPALPGEL